MINPKDFYHEIHRPSHFLNFAKSTEEAENIDYGEKENNFA